MFLALLRTYRITIRTNSHIYVGHGKRHGVLFDLKTSTLWEENNIKNPSETIMEGYNGYVVDIEIVNRTRIYMYIKYNKNLPFKVFTYSIFSYIIG